MKEILEVQKTPLEDRIFEENSVWIFEPKEDFLHFYQSFF